jgi:hypothetical protein
LAKRWPAPVRRDLLSPRDQAGRPLADLRGMFD